MSRVEVMKDWPVLVDGDAEVLVNIHFIYYPAYPGVMNPPDRAQPPEPEDVEIVKVEYAGGARTVVEEEIFMASVRQLMEMDGDNHFLNEMEDAVLEHVHEEMERMAEAHAEEMMERRLDDGDF